MYTNQYPYQYQYPYQPQYQYQYQYQPNPYQEWTSVPVTSSHLLQIILSKAFFTTRQEALLSLNDYVNYNKPKLETLQSEALDLVQSHDYKVLLNQAGVSKTVKELLKIYSESWKTGCHPMIPRLLMYIIGKIKAMLTNGFDKQTQQIALEFWTKVDNKQLGDFLDLFNIRQLINPQDKVSKIQQLLKSSSISSLIAAAGYITELDLQSQFANQNLIERLTHIQIHGAAWIILMVKHDPALQKVAIDICMANKKFKFAGELIKTFNLNPAEYPLLLQELIRASLRYQINDAPWMQVEARFASAPEILSLLVEELIQSKKALNEALSIIKRRNLFESPTLLSQKIRTIVSPYFTPNPPAQVFMYIENTLYTNDEFLPTEELLGSAAPNTYWNLKDFGLNFDKEVLFIDNQESFMKAFESIMSAEAIGFDSEFAFNLTRFDSSGVATIQISTRKQVFVIDHISLMKLPEYNQAILDLLAGPVKKVGHTLSSDIKKIREGQEDKEKKLVTKNLINIDEIYKVLFPHKKISLKAICEDLLKKPMSKFEQISSWQCRPLRKAQLHYAALDAVITLELYIKLQEIVVSKGRNMEQLLEEIEKEKAERRLRRREEDEYYYSDDENNYEEADFEESNPQ